MTGKDKSYVPPPVDPIRAWPIDDNDLPGWARRYLSPDQLRIEPKSMWVLLFDEMDYRPTRKLVALRLHMAVLGRQDSSCAWIGVDTMASKCGCSPTTVRHAYRDLEHLGWLKASGMVGKAQRYLLAWPAVDPNVSSRRGACGHPLMKKREGVERHVGFCSRPAGFGTAGDIGPCFKHGGARPFRQPLADQPVDIRQPLLVFDGLRPPATDGCPSPTDGRVRHSLTAVPSPTDGEVVTEVASLKSLEAAMAGGLS